MRKYKILIISIVTISIYLIPNFSDARSIPHNEHSLLVDNFGWTNNKAASKQPEYASGEVLVKFKEETDPSLVLEDINLNAKDTRRIHSIKPVVAKFRKSCKLEKDSEGWFWYMGKKYKEIDEIPDEEIFKEAYDKMPNVEKSLYRSYKITLPEGMTVEQAIAQLKDNPNIEYVEPNYVVKTQMVPNDPYYLTGGSWGQPYDDLWGLKKIQCEQAWDISQGEGVIVAVIDTGVDYNHEDITENTWINIDEIPNNGIDDDNNGYVDDVRGWDFIGVQYWQPSEDNNPTDANGHGTHVSGIIAAVGNNNIGVIGVAPKAKIMILKMMDDHGVGLVEQAGRAIVYAVDNYANVLNNSWGFEKFYLSRYLEDTMSYAHSKGCAIVVAAGNDERNAMLVTPANIPQAITVAASDADDKPASFTNYGIGVEISAPGYNILSLRAEGTDMYGGGSYIVGERYYRASGTSTACPYVSGVAALIISQNKANSITWSPEQITSGICAASDKPSDLMIEYFYWYNHEYSAYKYGYGRVNAYKALLVNNPKPFPFTEIEIPSHLQPLKGTVSFTGSAIADSPMRHLEFWWDQVPPPHGFYGMDTNDFITPDSYDSIQNGTLSEFNTNQLKDGQYHFISYIEDAGSRYQNIEWRSFYIANSEKGGFPIPINDNSAEGVIPFARRPLFYDLDNDGAKEILVNTDKGIVVLKGDGSVYWSVEPNGEDALQYSSPSVGDVDGDGIPEVVAVAMTHYVNIHEAEYVLRIFNSKGTLAKETPLGNFNGYRQPLILYDLDNNGQLEIIMWGFPMGWGEKRDLIIKTFDHEGNPLQSIIAIKDDEVYIEYGSYPAVSDIDNDGEPEIVIGASVQYRTSESLKYQSMAMVFNRRGELKWKTYFPKVSSGNNTMCITLADVNNDGEVEVIATVNSWYDNAFIYILKAKNGEMISSWPIYFTMDEPPILANLDQDIEPEIIYASSGEVQAWNWDGSFVLGWESIHVNYPTQGDYIPKYSSVIAADVDGDHLQEIIVGSASAIYILDRNGILLDKKHPGWWTRSYVGVADIDGDGKTELCAVNISDFWIGGFQGVHIWPLMGNGSHDDWPMFQHDAQHTGCYTETNSRPSLNPIGNKIIDEGSLLKFTVSATDLDGGPLTYSASNLPEGATFDATTQIFRWIPNYNQGGVYTNVHFEVTDGSLAHYEEITITVNNVNRPPILDHIGNKTVNEGQLLQFTISATDPDDDTLIYSAINLPAGATFNIESKTFTWTSNYIQAGTYNNIKFAVTDWSLSDEEVISITVNEVGNPPEIQFLYPTKDYPGKYIWLRGRDFGIRDSLSRVHFSGPEESGDAQIRCWYNRAIMFRVPDLESGVYNVTVINKRDQSNAKQFKILQLRPSIFYLMPMRGTTGTNITIYGIHFRQRNDLSKVLIYDIRKRNPVPAQIISWNNNQVIFTIPNLYRQGWYFVRVINKNGSSNYRWFYYLR